MILLPIGIICAVICKVREQKEEEKPPEKIDSTPKKEPPYKKLYKDEGAPWIHGEWENSFVDRRQNYKRFISTPL